MKARLGQCTFVVKSFYSTEQIGFGVEKHHSLVLYCLQHGDPCRPSCNVCMLYMYEVAVVFATIAKTVSVISKVLQW